MLGRVSRITLIHITLNPLSNVLLFPSYAESVYKDKDVEAIVNIMKSPSPQIDIQVVQTSMTDKPRVNKLPSSLKSGDCIIY